MDLDEFRAMVEEHQRMVYSIALRVVGDTGAAEEVAQDAFLQLFLTMGRLESGEHIRYWLRRVTVHRATDALRRRAVRPERGAEEWTEELHPGDPLPVMSSVMETRMEELLRTLPETMRVAVVLRYQEEMLPEEIAAMLGRPAETVKSDLKRGLKLLRRKAMVTMKEFVRERI
jgi:RNA polymerase sigma-70 factor, ECF subfamily